MVEANVFQFQAQDSSQTIGEALAELRAQPGLVEPAGLSAKAQELFDAHDTAHVVFGCDTSLEQEVLIDVWTLFGSDVSLAAYGRYLAMPEALELVQDAGVWRSLRTAFASRARILSVIRRARAMRSLWPWQDHDAFGSRSLAEIRAELGIEVVGPEA